jgi:hypothetical protein
VAAPKIERRIVCRLKTTPADKAALKRLAAGDSVALGALFDDCAERVFGAGAQGAQAAPKTPRT